MSAECMRVRSSTWVRPYFLLLLRVDLEGGFGVDVVEVLEQRVVEGHVGRQDQRAHHLPNLALAHIFQQFSPGVANQN